MVPAPPQGVRVPGNGVQQPKPGAGREEYDRPPAWGSSPLRPGASCRRRTRKDAAVSYQDPAQPQSAERLLAIETRQHRRTALVDLRGELDILTASRITRAIEGLRPEADGVRHIVLDLRGLTFMDCTGLREILKQNDFARSNHHNVAFVRGK